MKPRRDEEETEKRPRRAKYKEKGK